MHSRKRAIKLSMFTLFVFYVFSGVCLAQSGLDFHILSQQVQMMAKEKQIYKELSANYPQMSQPQLIFFYLDTMTFSDVVASKRAELLERGIKDEDIELGFSLECLIPFGPVHEKQKEEIKKIRPIMVSGAFVFSAKREKIREAINTELIKESKANLIEQNRGLFDIMNVNLLLQK